ncbi:hypothetical protein ScPMuIL_014515 [Solemya velum]
MSNPDGRAYLERTKNYCWRGTGNGVDLNRNFDWEFGQKGSSSLKTDEEYRGTHAFSEPESRVFTDVSRSINLDAFVSFHSGIRQIYIPYADSKSKSTKRKPANSVRMLDLARQLSRCTKHTFKYGQATNINTYSADGTIFDYMAGQRKVPFSIVIELWGDSEKHKGKSCFDLFNPPSGDLKAVIADIHSLYVTLFSYLMDWKASRNSTSQVSIKRFSTLDEPPFLTLTYIIVAMVLVALVLVIIQGRLPFFSWCIARRRLINLRSLSTTFSVNVLKL